MAVPYDIPKGNVSAYFPEANPLVPISSVAKVSNTPTSKYVVVTVVLAEASNGASEKVMAHEAVEA